MGGLGRGLCQVGAALLALALCAAAAWAPCAGLWQQGVLFCQAPAAALALPASALAAPAMARPQRPGGRPGQSQQQNQNQEEESQQGSAATPTPAPTTVPTAPPTAAPSPTAAPVAGTAPQLKDPGTIRAETYRQGSGAGFVQLAAGTIQNLTENADSDLLAAATTPSLPFEVELNSPDPQVLILHTHATETYQTWPDLVFDRSFTARTQNTALNMCAVGARMAEILNAAGVNTLHDTTLHDSPSYTESYARSRATAQEYLAQYPSIKIILDVHRDAIEDNDGTRVKPVCEIDGEPTAQVMIIAGCDNGGTVRLPNWRLNLRFAAGWQAAMEARTPSLTRPVLCAYRYYNQDLTTGSLLIEIGSHANTLAEALRAGEYAAQGLAALLGADLPEL